MRDFEPPQASGCPAPLPPCDCFGLLKISGPDAKKFLQGQVTCNLDALSASASLLGAHCNPKGRVLFLFRLFFSEDAYYLVLPKEMAAPACLALKKYAVFFKLALQELPEEEQGPLAQQAAGEWASFDLAQGIPQVYSQTSGLFLAHDLNLHLLQGLSWDKGCYTGQEIIARMQYRGQLKNHLYHAHLQTPALPRPGAELYCLREQKATEAGFIVDYRQLRYNSYHVLALASENYRSSALTLDPQQNETWEWLK